MTSRILPRDEWWRLEGTEAETLWPNLETDTTQVVVVEDGDQIVGCWVLLRVVHAECVWIKPSHRGRVSVVGRLLREMWAGAARWGATRVVTGSVSPLVTDLIGRLGGVPVPGDAYVLPGPSHRPTDRELGHHFHTQLFGQVPEDPHPDDAAHDAQVGRAMRVAIEEESPIRAVETYNTWAQQAGYAPIQYLGQVNGRVRADIVTAVIDIDSAYTVTVIPREEAPCQL